MKGTLTIRLDKDLERALDQLCKRTGQNRSEIVRDALRRQLLLRRFEELRRRVLPFAEARGYLVGTGSACSSKKKDRTRVMEAMGLSVETALSAVRVSMGPSTTEADIDGLLDALARDVPAARALARGSGR